MFRWGENTNLLLLDDIKNNESYAKNHIAGQTNPMYLTLLDENYKKADINIPGIKTQLYDYQRTSLQALIDAEHKHKLKIRNRTIQFSGIVYSDQFGSGKTLVILAWILAKPRPKRIPSIKHLYSHNPNTKLILSSCIKRTYREYLKPTLIFVSVTVINQWISQIKLHTDIINDVLVVGNVKDLQVFFEMVETREINKYKIVLIKNGKISSGDFQLPDGLKLQQLNKQHMCSIFSLIGNLTHVAFMRCIIDDADMIQIPTITVMPNARFTALISGTNKGTKLIKSRNINHTSFINALQDDVYNTNRLSWNQSLYTFLNIRCSPDYINRCSLLSPPRFYVTICKHAQDNALNLMSKIDSIVADMKDIQFKLNNNAYADIVRTNNIHTSNPIEIIAIILNKQTNILKESMKISKFCSTWLNADLPSNTDYKYGVKNIRNLEPPEYISGNIKNIITKEQERVDEIIRKVKLVVNRTFDNLASQKCPFCHGKIYSKTDTISDSDSDADDERGLIFLKCCSCIGHPGCIYSTMKFSAVDGKKIAGVCQLCKTPINISELIYFDGDCKGITTSDIIEEKFEDTINNVIEIKKEQDKTQDKVAVLINIITNHKFGLPADIKIPQLQLGKNKETEHKSYRKWIIFDEYMDNIKKIESALNSHKIHNKVLSGGASSVCNIIYEFREHKSESVLIINRRTKSSGLNLEFCSDIIFMSLPNNEIDKDPAIEAQCCGRGQRIGRTSTLNIHYILYANEYHSINDQNRISFKTNNDEIYNLINDGRIDEIHKFV